MKKRSGNSARRNAQPPVRERRFVKSAEVRADDKTGKISGHAAVFNEEYVLWDSPGFRIVETVKPGTFKKALTEKQDVRALFNHEPSNLLGRTSSGTLQMREDSKGLFFDCEPPDTQVARDVRALIKRGDLSGCSFAFQVTKQTRTEEEKDGKTFVRREIQEVDLYDVGPVTYPAYEGTDVNARCEELRSMFPDGSPAEFPELRAAIEDTPSDDGDGDEEPDGDEDDIEECSCRCRACFGGDHEECSDYMADCPDAERCGDMAAMRSAELAREKRDGKKTKRVDGEDLSESAFAYVGDPNDTSTWKLPIKFSTEEKTKAHIRNALARFGQTKGIPESEKPKVLAKIKAAAKAHGIHVSDEQNSAEVISLEHARARTETLLAGMSV